MSFLDKLRKVLPYITMGAGVVAGMKGGRTQAITGIALNTVEEVLAATQHKGNPVAAVADAARVNAIAIDDHQADIKALQARIDELEGKQARR